jgi:chromosome segregation ATPase
MGSHVCWHILLTSVGTYSSRPVSQRQLWRLEDDLQAAKKSVDDAQEKLAGAAAERAAAAAARDKEIWARDAEIRRLQSKVDAAESAVAARRAETERMKELVELREKEAQAAERSRAEASLAFDALTQAALQKQQLAHTEELRSIARERTKDAARLSEAEAAMQALRAEIVAGGQRVAAAEAAAQEAREGAEVLLQQVQSVHDRAEGGTGRPFPQCIFVTSCTGISKSTSMDSSSNRQQLPPKL